MHLHLGPNEGVSCRREIGAGMFGIFLGVGLMMMVTVVCRRRCANDSGTHSIRQCTHLVRCVWCSGSLKLGLKRFAFGRDPKECGTGGGRGLYHVVHDALVGPSA